MIDKANFILRRRSKIIVKEIPLLFGICGFARCGKDTLATHLSDKFSRMGLPSIKLSLAYKAKADLNDVLMSNFNISSFTEDSKIKEIIRPFIVAYATGIARKIDPDFWIKKLSERIEVCKKSNIISIIPDVRYENEVRWIQQNGGYVIHLTRMGSKPANFEEKVNNPIIKKLSDYRVKWKTFSDEKETCSYHINKLFLKNGWSTYGNFK